MLLLSENPLECHEEVLSLQPMILPKRFDIFPLTGGCSEGLDAFSFYFNLQCEHLYYNSSAQTSGTKKIHSTGWRVGWHLVNTEKKHLCTGSALALDFVSLFFQKRVE